MYIKMCENEEKRESRVHFSNPHRLIWFCTINKKSYFPHRFLFLLVKIFLMKRIMLETWAASLELRFKAEKNYVALAGLQVVSQNWSRSC